MNTQSFTYCLEQPGKIRAKDLDGLRQLTEAFPYFQAARALYLKGLKDRDSLHYNQQLKQTAAHTTDRSVLFDYITSEAFVVQEVEPIEKSGMVESQSAALHQSLQKEQEHEQEKAEAILDPGLFARKERTETSDTTAAAEPLTGKPLDFSKADTHSFQEWLKLLSAKPIDRSDNESQPPVQATHPKEKRTDRFALIDRFIADTPKIDLAPPSSSKNLAKPFTKPNDALMTETLARVYVEQKNYKKAIQAYKILILKNPEKSGFFADRIRAIEKLQNKKTE